MTKDLVSVIIPTKDRPLLVERAVNSALGQTYNNLEIIVVDDCSLEPFSFKGKDSRIKVIRNTSSVGGAAARNIGLKAAQGKYICLLDDDDYYLPEKIEKQFSFLQRNPAVDMVFSKATLVNEESGYYIDLIEDNYNFDVMKNFYQMNVIHTNATLFKKEITNLVTFDERLKKYQDTQFHLAVSLSFNVSFLPETVAVWNIDDRNDRVNTKKSVTDFRRDYESFGLICQIFSEILESDMQIKKAYFHRLAFLGMRANERMEAKRLFRELGRYSARPTYLFYLFVLKSRWFLRLYQRIRLRRHKLKNGIGIQLLTLTG